MMNSALTVETVNRWFIRCTRCLTVASVETAPNVNDWRCDICDGTIENMGRVEGDRLVKFEERCACDGRCTGARGPVCECSCGGKNHGTGRTVIVKIDVGGVPRVKFVDEGKAKAQAAEFVHAMNCARAELSTLRTKKAMGMYLDEKAFRNMLAIPGVLRKATEARTHAGRMKTLNAVL